MKTPSTIKEINQTEGLSTLIREIVRIADPEKILLLSACYDYHLKESIFIKNPVQEYKSSHYDLLILSDIRNKKLLAKKDMMTMARLFDCRNLQFNLMDIHEFNKKVEAGDEFENFILLNAMLCYDKGGILLSDPKQPEKSKA